MNRLAKFERKYKRDASKVLRSVAVVAATARWGDAAKIETSRQRHIRLMKKLKID